MMLREIILHELLDHLRSLRFSLTILLVAVLMLTGGVLYVGDYRQLTADHSENVNENLRLLEGKARKGLYNVVSFGPNQLIYRAPNPLGFIAEGHEKDLPNVFAVDAFELKGPYMKLRGNYTLRRFDQLDWVFIVGVILSFGALVLIYDAISGERESGTLRLCLSNPVSRSTLLIGKHIGAVLSLAIPLTAGVFMSLLIVSISGVIPLGSADWLRIGIIMLLSILYISAFVMLGLFISSLTRNSAISLVLSLLVWVCLVVIVPGTGGLLASRLVRMPDEDVVSQRAGDAMNDALKQYHSQYGKGRGLSYNWSPGEPLTRSVGIADAQIAVYDEYRNQQLNQVKLAQNLTRVSPMVIHKMACESLIGTGVGHYERFLKQARQYKRDLLQFTYSKYPLNPDLYQDRGELEKARVEFDEIPKFTDRPSHILASLADAGWDILLLFLYNVVFFMGAFVAFIRYSV